MDTYAAPTRADARRQLQLAGIALAGLALALGALVLRLVYIDTALSPKLQAIADSQQESYSTLQARRGSIVDTRGRVMAVSESRSSIFADPGMIEHPDEVARELAPILNMEAGEIENEIRASGTPRFCWLKRRVADAVADAVTALKLPGIGLRSEFERHWPMHETAAQIIGFVGIDGNGLEGAELAYDGLLCGKPGKRSVLRDVRRRALGAGNEELIEPSDGGHLMLTIDSVIQSMAEVRLREQVEKFEAESGVAVVMSPKTGAILALVAVPTYDANDHQDAEKGAKRIRAITDPVEPGSIFKPFVMAGALAGHFVRPNEVFNCYNGVHQFGGRTIHDTHPKGELDVTGIIVHSSNIGMGQIGMRMGNAVLRETLAAFGFGAETQIGLPGESGGIVPPLRRWNSYSTTSVPMGQEIAVTPLQLATAFCALVNHGILLRPRLVRAKLAADYTPIEEFDTPEIIRRVMPAEVADFLRTRALVGVVEEGGEPLDAAPYQMCGKTGTAQVPYRHRRGYEPNAYLSSFMGAAPAEDPELVTLVMVRKPNRAIGYYGRVVAGPVVRDIMRESLLYLEVPAPARAEGGARVVDGVAQASPSGL
ncbi:MAG TPA: penicillin-binding protein 2 [Phycisphaerae bacterium]|nr:penicillin-binding protein 2 [Phycisphaerae bacterium]